MVSLCAAVAAAVAAYQWRRASATRRVVPPGPAVLALLGRSAYALATRRRTVRRRGRETVVLVRALAAELRAGAPEATAFAAATSVASVSGGSLRPWLVSATAAVTRGGLLPAELRRVAEVRGAERLLPVAAAW
ncbi:MAG: hypothetical protein QOD07_1966, partial [Frankiaceae bacterium]|nr:hypothetical protein [Frankiaceae bacterium]